jgi:hypothetical protein
MSTVDAGGNGKQPLKDRVQKLAGQGKAMADGATNAVLEHARERPYATLAAAFGVGYVLGGGLFSKTTVRLLGLGVKLAAVPAVQDFLLDAASVALDTALAQGRKFQGPEGGAPPASAPGAPQA